MNIEQEKMFANKMQTLLWKMANAFLIYWYKTLSSIILVSYLLSHPFSCPPLAGRSHCFQGKMKNRKVSTPILRTTWNVRIRKQLNKLGLRWAKLKLNLYMALFLGARAPLWLAHVSVCLSVCLSVYVCHTKS